MLRSKHKCKACNVMNDVKLPVEPEEREDLWRLGTPVALLREERDEMFSVTDLF